MHPNDNEFDQTFRDRLRNHSSPVRGDLWRRVHTGVNTPARPVHFLRYWRYLGAGAGTITVALAAHLIFTPSHPSHPKSTNHYSIIPAATASRAATAKPPVTASATTIPTPAASPASAATTKPTSPATGSPRRPSTTHSNYVTTYLSADSAVTDLTTTTRDRDTWNSTARSRPGYKRATPDNPAANHAAGREYRVTLPAIVRTSARPDITIRPSSPLTRHADPAPDPAGRRFIKTGYASLYGSPDFPANHYYTWSYTFGGTVTIQFGRHWSGTTGFEYGRVNVPTQQVPPVTGDTQKAFYWSNYQVPVLVGYTMMLGDYALTVNSGAILNLYFHRSTGDWVNNWPDRDSYGAYLGADIFRPVGHSIRVFAQPYARYSISNYRMFIPVQRFFYGVHLGLRYQL